LKDHQGVTQSLPPVSTVTTSVAQGTADQAVSIQGAAVEGLEAGVRSSIGFQTQACMGTSWIPREVRTVMFTVRSTAWIGTRREVRPSPAEGQMEKGDLSRLDNSLDPGINLTKASPRRHQSAPHLRFLPSLHDQGLVVLPMPPLLSQAERQTALQRLDLLVTRDSQSSQHSLHLVLKLSRPCIRRRA